MARAVDSDSFPVCSTCFVGLQALDDINRSEEPSHVDGLAPVVSSAHLWNGKTHWQRDCRGAGRRVRPISPAGNKNADERRSLDRFRVGRGQKPKSKRATSPLVTFALAQPNGRAAFCNRVPATTRSRERGLEFVIFRGRNEQ